MVCIESTVAVLYTSFFIGVVFAKATRPKAAIRFSKVYIYASITLLLLPSPTALFSLTLMSV